MANTENNWAKKRSIMQLEDSFIALLQQKPFNKISITEICKLAKVNRSTFYANFIDIYDLIEKIQDNMIHEISDLYEYELSFQNESASFFKLFTHIKDNKNLYKTYFKLDLDLHFSIANYNKELAKKLFNNQYLDYHSAFFRAGITSIIKKWLSDDCNLSPLEMTHIIESEYQNKIK
ncbi:TetR family transcriptional regulator [Lactobacillus sp. S2-2]|uniref:TetR/AcrR family transcriptional regulator n=1 Tax=Lactobacillus sp. S2-2 TaxID=2692917 RepID=UPI001F47CDF5|nr:TetR-like C-terminal domain-containing protein [Lactobacillus sp. S2-2]MCF6515430.1 TetR family transcriptional regulator [Lactobacillus sp. S2-2]